jgi:hypothetical protein
MFNPYGVGWQVGKLTPGFARGYLYSNPFGFNEIEGDFDPGLHIRLRNPRQFNHNAAPMEPCIDFILLV